MPSGSQSSGSGSTVGKRSELPPAGAALAGPASAVTVAVAASPVRAWRRFTGNVVAPHCGDRAATGTYLGVRTPQPSGSKFRLLRRARNLVGVGRWIDP